MAGIFSCADNLDLFALSRMCGLKTFPFKLVLFALLLPTNTLFLNLWVRNWILFTTTEWVSLTAYLQPSLIYLHVLIP